MYKELAEEEQVGFLFRIIIIVNVKIILHMFPEFIPTRWLSFGRLCDEILRQWPGIEKYFRSINDRDCPKFMRKVFNDERPLISLEFKTLFAFASFAIGQFNKFNLISQVSFIP